MNRTPGWSRPAGAFAVAMAAVFIASCGGGDSGPTDNTLPPPPPGIPNSELITPSGGGLLISDDGAARVLVPPGAVADTVTITVEKLAAGTTPQQFVGRAPVGGIWQFGPTGFRFLKPVEVTLAFESELPPGFDDFPFGLFTTGLDGEIEPLQNVRFVPDVSQSRARKLVLSAAGLRGLISHFSPFSKALVALDVLQADGISDGAGSFQSASDVFKIGHGGPFAPDSLVYEVQVTNEGAIPATGVRLTDRVALATQNIRFRQILFVSQGSTSEVSEEGFTWNIGTLAAGTRATIRFRAEAIDDGIDVNRISLTADQSLGAVVLEEPTTVAGPSTPAIALDLSHEDGLLDAAGIFQSAKDLFRVGESGDSLAYEIQLVNQSGLTATGVQVIEELTPTFRILDVQAVRFISQGEVTQLGPGGFTWDVGTLPPNTGATLWFTATARQEGFDVSRATFQAQGLVPVRNEESIIVAR